MLLAIDIGNTHTVLGIYKGKALTHTWRLVSDAKKTVDEYALQVLQLLALVNLESNALERIIISSVVPELGRVFTKLSQKYFQHEPIVVRAETIPNLQIRVDEPKSVGADRLVNALAVRELYGTPAVVVDFGTATTFDVVAADGAYEGGMIVPGIAISAEALFSRAALLPRIEITKPQHILGKNTKDAMLSGIYWGYVSLVEGMLERLFLSHPPRSRVIATGGFARIIAEGTNSIEQVVPELTLEGLRLISEKH